MSARRPNHRLVKVHYTYSVGEVAALLGVHKNTIRNWLAEGLATIDRRRPCLVDGAALLAFLKAKRARNKKPCGPGEIYCLRCRAPRIPADKRVVYRPLSAQQGNLIGECPDCSTGLYRRVSLAKLDQAKGDLRVAIPEGQQHISLRAQPSLKCDFNQGDSP